MKAPDKIIIFPDDYPTLWYMPDEWETVPSGNVEYIRKDALLEWINKARTIPHENAIARDLAFQEVVNYLVNEM